MVNNLHDFVVTASVYEIGLHTHDIDAEPEGTKYILVHHQMCKWNIWGSIKRHCSYFPLLTT